MTLEQFEKALNAKRNHQQWQMEYDYAINALREIEKNAFTLGLPEVIKEAITKVQEWKDNDVKLYYEAIAEI